MNSGNASWEITRWSGVLHGFTSWESSGYNLRADIRSWDQAISAFDTVMVAPERVAPGPSSTRSIFTWGTTVVVVVVGLVAAFL